MIAHVAPVQRRLGGGWLVQSLRPGETYRVYRVGARWVCECAAHRLRGHCRHVELVWRHEGLGGWR